MAKSENLQNTDQLYKEFCTILKRSGGKDIHVPSKAKFLSTLKTFNSLVEGHKKLLFAIGNL